MIDTTSPMLNHERTPSVNQPPRPMPPQPPMPTQAAPKPKKPRRWPWILGMIGTLILGIIIGTSSAGSSTGAPPAVTVAPTPPATGTAAAPATQAPAAAGPKTEFGDGTYKVGEDIAAGTYKSTGPRSGSPVPLCYWARMKNDSGSVDAIIANNNSQGPTRVTVKAGEYLQVTGCDFTKA